MSSKSENIELKEGKWHLKDIKSHLTDYSISVIVAKDIPYIDNPNRFQNLTIYLPKTSETIKLLGTHVKEFTFSKEDIQPVLPNYLVHIHGGAWRDPLLDADSIEATVAHAFDTSNDLIPILGIVSINYSLSQFQTHPHFPYDAIKDNHSDISREAIHPQHISDVLHGLNKLRSFGINDHSYILSGHSCGACIAFQTILQPPSYYGLTHLSDPPSPAAILGLNGLYDLPELVYGLGTSHEHLSNDYKGILTNAYGSDENTWATVSPSRFDIKSIRERFLEKKGPALIMVDRSTEDQLVPTTQQEILKANLSNISEIQTIEGKICKGDHALPWKQGLPIWQNVRDILHVLKK
jgi:acetyl esterase/lipase